MSARAPKFMRMDNAREHPKKYKTRIVLRGKVFLSILPV